MPDDNKGRGFTPRINRTNSVFPAGDFIGPAYGGEEVFIRTPQGAGSASRNVRSSVPAGMEFVRVGNGGIYVRPKPGAPRRPYGPTVAESQRETDRKRYEQQATRARGRAAMADYEKSVRESLAAQYTINGVVAHDPAATGVDPNLTYDPTTGKVRDKQGNEVSTSYAARTAKASAQADSVFSALNLDSIDPSARFLMTIGAPANDPTNPHSSSGPPILTQDLRAGRGPAMTQRTDAERYGNQPNMMTVGEGVNWFRNLSVNDPEAYNELIVKMWDAGYLNGSDVADLPLGGFSSQAAAAFAVALTDLSQANQAGDTAPLLDWLNRRGKAKQDATAAAQAYRPVDRQYTDPEAVRAAAQSAAEDLLGRGLTDDEKARFTAHFRGLENQMYDQVDTAGRAANDAKNQHLAPPGAATFTRPDLSGQAEAFIDQGYGTEAAGQRIGSYVDVLRQLVGL